MLENIEILNLSQRKEEETNWCQSQIIMLQHFISNRNERKNTEILMSKSVHLGL